MDSILTILLLFLVTRNSKSLKVSPYLIFSDNFRLETYIQSFYSFSLFQCEDELWNYSPSFYSEKLARAFLGTEEIII